MDEEYIELTDFFSGIIQEEPETECEWCKEVEDKNYRFEYYLIDNRGHVARYKMKNIIETSVAKYCPNCGRRLAWKK